MSVFIRLSVLFAFFFFHCMQKCLDIFFKFKKRIMKIKQKQYEMGHGLQQDPFGVYSVKPGWAWTHRLEPIDAVHLGLG